MHLILTLPIADQHLIKLNQLLRCQVSVSRIEGSEFDFLMPQEKLAKQLSSKTTPDSARLYLCHWHVGIDDIRMENPAQLSLTTEQTQTLVTAMQPYFHEDGLALVVDTQGQIWVKGASITQLVAKQQLASTARVIGRHVLEWLPSLDVCASEARTLRRLQNEMQMLLYTHPINQAREAQGLTTVNSFWVSESIDSHPAQEQAATRLPELLRHVQAGQIAQLTLCGERHCDTYTLAKPRGITSVVRYHLRGLWGKPLSLAALEDL